MKLKQIHIYGFGRLNDFKVDNIEDMQLFFGENEAGKSTIMSFIHSILFGFPTLQQSELRYEPKTHTSYGGKLVFESEKYGEVVIERVKGKAAGDVNVLLEDGPAEASDFLPTLLNGTDKTMYRSVFSFDLQGIQEIQRLKEDDIGKYLIAAGTVGTDDLLQVEKQIQRELNQLFKPGGRKPMLNEQLKNLRHKEQQLKHAKQQNALYESLLAEIEEINSRVKTSKELLDNRKEEHGSLSDIFKKWPLIKERNQIRKRLLELDGVAFPTDGLKRLEKYNDRLLEISSTLKTVEQRIANIKREMKENAFLVDFNTNKAETFIREWPKQQLEMEEMAKLEHVIAGFRTEYESIVAELHYSSEKTQSVKSLNLGIDMKARIKETLQQYMRYEGRMKDLEDRLELDRKEIIALENACEAIEKQLVSESTFKDWKALYERRESAADLEEQRKELQEEVEGLKNRKKRADEIYQKKKSQTVIFSSAFLLIFFSMFLWGFLSKQWTLTIVAVAGIVYTIVLFLRRGEGTSPDFITETLNAKREKLKRTEELLETSIGDINIVHQFKQQLVLREKWKDQFSRLEEQKKKFEESSSLLQRVRDSVEAEEKKLDDIKVKLGLSENFSRRKIEDAFSMLKELQQLDQQIGEIEAQKVQILKGQEKWHENLFQFLMERNIEFHEPAQAIYFLQETLKKEQEKEILLKELGKKLSELNVNILQIQNEKAALLSSLNKLFEAADVTCEEDFRKKAGLFEERSHLLERLALLEDQLGEEDEKIVQNQDELQRKINGLSEEMNELSRHLEEDRNRLAILNQEVRFLEEGGTYTENLHHFRQMRSTFNEEAHGWAELAVAASLLEKVMGKYKEGRFPKVIRKATEYFSFLTDDEYIRLHVHPDGNLTVERKDRILFSPAELSRGTGEQLYIAIRLALVHVLKEEYPFPVIIDDGFVNFDQERTKRMLQLIQNFSADAQVLLFTCHGHIANQFSDEQVIHIQQRLLQPNVAE
ncbi:P-loop containing nucleoside triphosphate hydrolase [Bacillus freudenreichii]|nr:P-loop containing nucleoside triphosphate hydrolase [Bacillus freudenreichii]